AYQVLLDVADDRALHVQHLAQGRAAYQDGDYRLALACCDQAVAADPTRADAYFARGRVHQRLRNFTAARADYQKAYNLAPSGRISAALAYCANHTANNPDAIGWYTRAIEEGFAPAEVYNNLGYSFRRRGQIQQARTYLDKALRKNNRL